MQRRDFHRWLAASALAGGLWGASPLAAVGEEPATGSTPLPIIDTHQHLWDLQRQNVPWVPGAAEVLNRSYVSRDYEEATKGCHIVKAVYMEVDMAPADHDLEVELITELCRGGKSMTVAAVIGGRPGEEGFAEYIRRHAKNPYVRGVRQVLHGATPRGYCLGETFVQSMRLLGELGLLFDICVRPDELDDAVKLVRKCPQTTFVIDHCGNGDPKVLLPASRRGGEAPSHDPEAWQKNMGLLGELPNAICKISGVVAKVAAADLDCRRPGAGRQSLP